MITQLGMFAKFEHFFTFRHLFLPHLELKFIVAELPVQLLSFDYLSLGNLGNQS